MAKDAEVQLHVGDVYDLAAEIGKEFEKVIDVHGTELVKELMTKVIVTLEYLESSTLIIDTLQTELYEIKAKVKQLEYEKLEKAEFRSKLDQELELIEENWRREMSQLNSLVCRLQEENKRLSSSLEDREHSSQQCRGHLTDQDLEVVQRLKEVADQHREQLLSKDRELQQKSSDLEKLQFEADSLAKVNKELAHRNRHLQKQMHLMLEEKTDLQTLAQDQQREFQTLQKQLSAAMKENIDLSTAENQLQLDLRGKLIIDVDDPNRPRFTLDELRHILFERNDLKAKISDLEDELNLYKPKLYPKPQNMPTVSPVPPERKDPPQEDLPVQGPINREPDEKLFPEKKGLGIRRFFRFLRRFSVDSPVPIMPFSASHQLPGHTLYSSGPTSL